MIDRTIVKNFIFTTLQISNDIYRNGSDADFVKNGGEIIYCFDTTVFNLFYDTYTWRHAVSSYRSDKFSNGDPSRELAGIEAQSALIASEYLLSEELPGAANASIYITPWHMSELAHSLNDLVSDFKRKLKEDTKFQSKVAGEIERKLRVVEEYRSEKATHYDSGRRWQLIRQDVQDLARLISDEDVIKRYAFTRRAAEVLVSCPYSERMDQILRIVSKPLQTRIKPLTDIFPELEPPSSTLSSEASRWLSRIEAEEKRAPVFRRKRRSRQAKINDAFTLALVRRASKVSAPHQRVVLITSDDTLFNAYRRWWVNMGEAQGVPEEHFFLRRSFQYTPIFNLSDSKNDISASVVKPEIEDLFEGLREAVETSLLPFNISRMADIGKRASHGSVMRGREYLALRARDRSVSSDGGDGKDAVLDFFLADKADQWFQEQSKRLGNIKRFWNKIERKGIGFFYEKINLRLANNEFVSGVKPSDLRKADSKADILKFLFKSLDAMTNKVRVLWLPIASNYIREQFTEDLFGHPARVPETIAYKFLDGRSLYDIQRDAHLPEESGVGKLKRYEFQEGAPEAMFVLAAVVALHKNQWWKAEEFASFANAAIDRRDLDHGVSWEVRFLHALTKRFRFGSLPIHTTSPDDPASTSFLNARKARLSAEADGILSRCISECSNKGRSAMLVRALSERAALKLFVATTLLVTDQAPPDLQTSPALNANLSDAESDLFRCLEMDLDGNFVAGSPLHAVRDQIYHNVASLVCVDFLARSSLSYEIPKHISKIMMMIEKKYHSFGNINFPALTGEHLCAKILNGTLTEFDEFASALEREPINELAVDTHLRTVLQSRQELLYDIFLRRSTRMRRRSFSLHSPGGKAS